MTKHKSIHRYNRNYKNFNFSDLTPTADEEYLELTVELDSEPPVYPYLAGIIRPGRPEDDLALRFHHPLDDSQLNIFRMLFEHTHQ